MTGVPFAAVRGPVDPPAAVDPAPVELPNASAPGNSGEQALSWVAAHGGAGASTLARQLGGGDLGCRWPDPARGESPRIALVARTSFDGLRAASRALNALREGRHPAGMELVTLVLVADAPGRLPVTLARRLRVLRSVAPVQRMPWQHEWRLGRELPSPPKALRRLADRVALSTDGKAADAKTTGGKTGRRKRG